jgi:hypothetical protein
MPTHAAMRDDPAKCPPSGGHFRACGSESAARWRLDAGVAHVRGKYVKSQEITRRYAIFLLFFCTAAA